MISAALGPDVYLLKEQNLLYAHQDIEPVTPSKIKNHLCGRAALAGASILSLIKLVAKAIRHYMCCPIENTPIHEMQPLSTSLTPEMRTWRVRHGAELIAKKLKNELDYAQKQATKEPDKAFKYVQAPAKFKGTTQSETITSHEVGISHYIGNRHKMEDEHLATSFNLAIGNTLYPIPLFGIFDGHAGNEAAIYIRDHLAGILHGMLKRFCTKGLTDEAIWNALKITFVTLHDEFKGSSGTTATIAIILDGKLWTANVGDSRTILDNGTQLSEDAKPTDPRYQRGIEHRKGFVLMDRINGVLAVARAIGDSTIEGVNERPKITVIPLSEIPKGSHLILACDGIYDVASTRQIAAATYAHRDQSAADLAANIVYSAYKAESMDNLSALVVKL